MLDSYRTTVYSIRCDRCDASGPEAYVEADVVPLAVTVGWRCKAKWNGLEYVHTHLCPECVAKEAE